MMSGEILPTCCPKSVNSASTFSFTHIYNEYHSSSCFWNEEVAISCCEQSLVISYNILSSLFSLNHRLLQVLKKTSSFISKIYYSETIKLHCKIV